VFCVYLLRTAMLIFSSSDFALWIKSFGAQVALNVNRQTTHVIANPDRKTTKVKKAARYPHIKIVNAEWMFQCCTRWERVDETPYLIELDANDRSGSPFEDLDDDEFGNTGDEDGETAESPVELDMSVDKWQDMEDEFQDFMDDLSDDTEGENSNSDSESNRSDVSAQTDPKRQKMKRKRSTASTDASDEDSDASVSSTSRLQRRKKRTMERVTSLNNVVIADKSSGLPSPETTGPEEGQGDEEKDPDPAGLADDDDSDADDDLEAKMMAQFEMSDEDED
jgi:RNA polymerase II subunit A-like phosphatase